MIPADQLIIRRSGLGGRHNGRGLQSPAEGDSIIGSRELFFGLSESQLQNFRDDYRMGTVTRRTARWVVMEYPPTPPNEDSEWTYFRKIEAAYREVYRNDGYMIFQLQGGGS